jgi:hypothetical protein
VSTTTPRSDSSSTTRAPSRDGPSSAPTITRSTVVSPRTIHGEAIVKSSPTSAVTVTSNGLSRYTECVSSPYNCNPSCPAHTGNTQNHRGYVSSAHPYVQKVTATPNENTDHGNCTTAYNSCRHDDPLRRTAPIHAIAPRPFGRNGSGADTSMPSSARARARSSAPNPRHPASPAASTGTPRNVISSPAPTDTIVTAYVNSRIPTGSPSSTYPNSRQLRASTGARSPAGIRCRRSSPQLP